MDTRQIADTARTILNELEIEGRIEPRLLQAVQLLVLAVQDLADSRRQQPGQQQPAGTPR